VKIVQAVLPANELQTACNCGTGYDSGTAVHQTVFCKECFCFRNTFGTVLIVQYPWNVTQQCNIVSVVDIDFLVVVVDGVKMKFVKRRKRKIKSERNRKKNNNLITTSKVKIGENLTTIQKSPI
jgi:hypothetical protein